MDASVDLIRNRYDTNGVHRALGVEAGLG
jgi:hypothetical protein